MQALLISTALIAAFAAPSGTMAVPASCPLRVAIVGGNAAQATRGADGRYTGVAVDVAQSLAARWGRTLDLSAMPPAEILAALERGAIDIGFVAANPARGGNVTYSQPYMLVLQTAMVAAKSPLRSVAELDRAGMRIGANTGDSIAMHLTRTLKVAQLSLSPDIGLDEATRWVREGTVAAFAGNRQRLGIAARANGLRLLPDDITAVPQAIATRADATSLRDAIAGDLARMQSDGAIATAIRRHRVDGVTAAPAGPSAPAAPPPPCV